MRYQIIRKPKGKDQKWAFVAHGARYGKADAEKIRITFTEKYGDKVRLLPC